MTIKQNSDGNISLCYKNYCLNANGQTGKILAVGAFALLLIVSISVLSNNCQKRLG